MDYLKELFLLLGLVTIALGASCNIAQHSAPCPIGDCLLRVLNKLCAKPVACESPTTTTITTTPIPCVEPKESILDLCKSTRRLRISDEVCQSPGCLEAASSILGNMDRSVKPCDDFYRFACGNFIKNFHLRGKDAYQVDDTIFDKLSEQLRNAIEDESQKSDPRAFKQLKLFYQSCMNNDKHGAEVEKDFLKLISEAGGWPLVQGDSWNKTNFNWIESILRLYNYGYSVKHLVSVDIVPDQKNRSKYLIEIDQNYFPISWELILNPSILDIYRNFTLETVEIFGAKRDDIKDEVEEMIQFEIALAKISQSNYDYQDAAKVSNPMTIERLQSICPSIDWVELINKILQPYAQVDSQEIVNVASLHYFEKLKKLLDTTDKRVLANYIMWSLTYKSFKYLSQRLLRVRQKYLGEKAEPQWKFCTDFVIVMDLAYDALYVRRYFDDSIKADVRKMTRNVRQSIRKVLSNEVDWMNEETKQAALEKLDAIKDYIAYPDEYMDNKKLDEYYSNLTISPDSFYKNVLSISAVRIKHKLANFRKPINKSEWIYHGEAAWVNAHYTLGENSINIDAGYLQGVYYSKDRPQYMNYATLASTIAHEITHAFDNHGSKYDKDGNLIDWWDPESKVKFQRRLDCLIDQYSQFKNKEFNVTINGTISVGENMADSGGIRAAYLAYEDWEARNGVEARLPNLNYTSRQLFWISAANTACEKYTKAGYEKAIEEAHLPGEFRIIGPLSNSPEFAKDFGCPIGSYMNPVKKCRVW